MSKKLTLLSKNLTLFLPASNPLREEIFSRKAFQSSSKVIFFNSRLTGINQKQLGHYMQGIRHPRKEQRARIIEGLHKLGKELELVE